MPYAAARGFIDLAFVLQAACGPKLQVLRAAGIAPYVSLSSVAATAEVVRVAASAVRALLGDVVAHAQAAGAVRHVGLHLWDEALPGRGIQILIADDRANDRTGSGAASLQDGAPRARRYLRHAGGQLVREPGTGMVSRITLP